MPPADARDLPDELLARQCHWDTFRGPGPGGQKRNKTSSAVRVTHDPTGLSASAGESRSQHRNKAAALARLRHRLALEVRSPLDLGAFIPPPWFAALLGPGGRLRLSPRD